MTKTKEKIPYGDWGYGLQTPIASEMSRRIAEHDELWKGEPRAREHYQHKGAADALREFVDQVYELESELSRSIVERLHKERHSGYGRGDSMG